MARWGRRITITLSVTAVAALLLWYLYPVLLYTVSMGGHEELQRRLDAEPTLITTPTPPPSDWQVVTIDTLQIRLPLTEFPNIESGVPGDIGFRGEHKRLELLDIVLSEQLIGQIEAGERDYPLTPYQRLLDALFSTSEDLSLFHSRSENMRGLVNQGVKWRFAGGNGGYSWVVTLPGLKAVVGFRKPGGGTYSAIAHVYSRDGGASLTVMMLGYTSDAELEADLLHILSGLRMYQTMPDPQRVTDDIGALVTASQSAQ